MTDPTMWSTLLHAGLGGSFLALPHVPPEAEAVRESQAGAAIFGMPWDSLTVSRSGANYGPRSIREISNEFRSYNAVWDFDLVEALHPIDCGDCPVIPGNAEKSFAMAQEMIGQIIAGGALPVTLGGDHSISIPALRAVKDAHETPGLVLLDTHLDTAPHVGGETLSNCSPITRAIDHGFDPRQTVLIGMSGWMNPRTEVDYCREQGITIIWLEDLWRDGVDAVIEQALAIAGGDHGLYLSVDVDALDGGFAPGTSTPTPGGMNTRELLSLVRGIAANGLVGFDVVETAPTLDTTGVTSRMAARIVLDGLAAHCGRVTK